MQIFSFGNTSKRRLSTCCATWRKILNYAISTSPIDFGVVCGGRGRKAQNKAFRDGFSRAKWGESDHNFKKGDKMCSLAVDVAPYCPVKKDYIWDDENLWLLLSNHIACVARRFGHKIEWGGRYVNKDSPHFSLRF